jgi:ABC-type transport system involved in multi-copper enzyme maturation permease subunit
MTALARQTRAEWRKLRTLRSTWAVLGVGLTAELVLRTVSAAIAPADGGVGQVVFALRPSIVFGIVVALLPLLLAAGEWRWRTAVSTYALQPSRGRVILAKSVVGAVTGLTVASVLTGTSLGVGVAVLHMRGLALPGTDTSVALALGPVAAGMALGVFGVAVGTVVRDQVVALTVAVVILFVIPLPLLLLGPEWYAWSPSAWVDALAGQEVVNPDLLPRALAGGLLAALAIVGIGAAERVLTRRDVA